MTRGGLIARRRRRREEGQTLVEFALVLPVLLLLLVGILKFGMLFNNYLTLTDVARAGARQLSLGRGSGTNPCTLAEQQAVTSDGSLNLAVGSSSFSESFPASNANVETCGNSATSWAQGDRVTFTATYPCDLKIMGVNFWPGASCTLSASATEAIE